MRKSQFEKVLAYHEAGHAVAARVVGVEIVDAFSGGKPKEISNGVQSRGSVRTLSASSKTRGTPAFRQALWIDTLVSLAGIAAQRKYRPQYVKANWEKARMEEWSTDIDRVSKLLCAYRYDRSDGMDLESLPTEETPELRAELQDLLNTASAEATKIIEDHWPQVERVAALLLSHGEITQADIDTAMVGAS
jgi:hypothetical protein